VLVSRAHDIAPALRGRLAVHPDIRLPNNEVRAMSQTALRLDLSNRLRHAPVRPILAEVWLGAERPGAEQGPAALQAGLARSSRVLEPVVIPDNAPPNAHERLHRQDLGFLPEIVASSEAIATAAADAIRAEELALTLGGDHAVAFGSLAGAAAQCERLGVLWIDAHADLNTPETSPSGHLHGMPLAAALGLGPAALTGIGQPGPKLRAADLALLGPRDVDPGERALIAREQIWTRSTDDWRRGGILETLDEALARLTAPGIDAVHVSFDLDVLDPSVLPGTGTAVPHGLSMEEARIVIERLRAWEAPLRSFDVVELNPALDPSGRSAANALALLRDLLAED
jgi:arginase